MRRRTPLAWKNLIHDPRRLSIAIAGVGFAVLLMFIEIGFWNSLLDSTVEIMRAMNGEVIVVSKAKYAIAAVERFELRRLQSAKGIEGVADAFPIYIEGWESTLRRTPSDERREKAQRIRVIAFRETDAAFNIRGLDDFKDDLQVPNTAIVDTLSHPQKFAIPPRGDLSGYRVELADRPLSVVGRFRLGRDFITTGNLIMSANNFAAYFPHRAFGRDPLSMVDIGVVQVDEGIAPVQVRDVLRVSLPADVDVFTKEEFIQREEHFWKTQAPVGYIFLVGMCVGFVVGVIIVYQIIYSDIADHMSEFATLKAMGYRNSYFFGLVLCQSVYLSLLGFIPGLIASAVIYQGLSYFTGMTMTLSKPLLGVLAITVCMCAVSGVLAVRKLIAADPASLF